MKHAPASTIDLIVLGFLLDKPTNAYELSNLILFQRIGLFLKISSPAVYKSCKRLAVEGYIQGERIKEGEQPEKTVYSVTPVGKERFLFLMEHFSSSFSPFFLECNAFIWNLEKIDKSEGRKMLKNLHDELSELNVWIMQHEKEAADKVSFAGRSIIKQYRMMLSALLAWSREVIDDYEANP
jgi:DNA-binding PadR family transcriptional regulator